MPLFLNFPRRLLLLAVMLAVDPCMSQNVREPVERYSTYKAQGKNLRDMDEMLQECVRGQHRTSGGVTSSGDGNCRSPRQDILRTLFHMENKLCMKFFQTDLTDFLQASASCR